MISRNSLGNTYPIKQLGDVVEFLDSMRRPVTESDRRAGAFPYYGANGLQGAIDDFIFDEPLLLLAEDGGHFGAPDRGIAYRVEGKTWVNNHAHVLKPKAGIDLGFLCRVLENYDVTPWVTGTTRGKLTQAGAAQIVVPVPPVAEQKRIAAILDKADALRAQRRTALARLDTLTQSIFLDMFGDFVAILNRWPTKRLGELLDFLTSGSRGWAEYYSNEGELFLRIQNVLRDELSLEDVAYVQAPNTAEAKRTRVGPGDVLLSITADLGRTAVVPKNIGTAFINQHLSILRTKSVVPRFLSAYLQSPAGQGQIFSRNRQAVKAGLNFDDIRSFIVPLPPIKLQQEFVERVAVVERLRVINRELSFRLDTLFASLQHRAFRGEL